MEQGEVGGGWAGDAWGVSDRASRVLLGWSANPRVVLLEDNTKVLGEEYWDQWDKHEYIVTMDWQKILGEKLLGWSMGGGPMLEGVVRKW